MAIEDQMAVQMADLGLVTRDTVYAPDADASGRPQHTTPAAQAAIAQAAINHRNRALASGDASTSRWNTPTNFTDVGEQGLTNFADGQGYRVQPRPGGQLGAHRAPRVTTQRSAPAVASRSGGGGTPDYGSTSAHRSPANLHYYAAFSSSKGGGTIYYGPSGSRGMPSGSIASGGQNRYAEFVAGKRGPTTIPGTQHVDPEVQSTVQSTVPHGGPVMDMSSASNLRQKRQRRKKDATDTFRDLMNPVNPVPRAHVPTAMEIQAQQQVNDLVAAAKTGTLNDKILRSQTDFPTTANLKILITDAAVEHSNPSGPVLNKPAELLNVFHSTREWLVRVTFRLVGLGDGPLLQDKLELMRAKVSPRYHSTLFEVVKQAKEDVATKPHDILEAEYRRAGKLDVLEKAIELHLAKPVQNAKPTVEETEHVKVVDTTVVETTEAPVVPAPVVPTKTTNTVPGNPVVVPTPLPVETTTLDVTDRQAPNGAAEVADHEDTPGEAKLYFVVNGSCHPDMVVAPLPAGLDVTVHMSPNFDDHKYLQNAGIYFDAFDKMVKILDSHVNTAKAAAAVEAAAAAEAAAVVEAAAAAEEDAADSDAANSSVSSGFGTGASYNMVRAPVVDYDSDESL